MFQVMRKHPTGPNVGDDLRVPVFPNGAAAADYVENMKRGDKADVSYSFEIRGCESWVVYRTHPVYPARAALADCVKDMDELYRAMNDGSSVYAEGSEFFVREV